MPLARFMELALQHPSYGYYAAGDPLGGQGDFITSPEISQLFGEMIGLWAAEIWRLSERPASFALLELGPGRGTLMQDALRATAKVAGFHEAMRLYLLESNATLREKQTEKLAAYAPVYLDDLSDLPPVPLIAVANEFFDALPVRQYIRTLQGWRERLVDWNGERFVFVHGQEDVPLPLPADFSFHEVSPQALALVQQLAESVAARGGAGLIVDYGYAVPAGHDTLQAVSHHESVPVLDRPGQVDLTAHVDFTALAIAAQKKGARPTGIAPQGDFLRAMGIELRAAQLKKAATDTQAKDIDSALNRLTDSFQMGVLFKVLAFSHPDLPSAPGFS